MPNFEMVVGLEVHAQLSTHTKMFCGCSAAFGGDPNTQVCPTCLGLPGALPVANERAVEFAVRMGRATSCEIASHSVFARKNYFYPDCPKNYQISQFDRPLCEHGHLMIDDGKKVGITRIHLEEDAGKLVHGEEPGHSLVDMNRSGVPLIEIVSEPDLRAAEEASQYLTKLRSIVRYLEICDGNMEEGSLRCDVNLSVREVGTTELGTKTEVKNLNSFKQVEQAIAFEFDRQVKLVTAGQRVSQDTMLWNADKGTAEVMRSKEEAHDYRYFPEPDLAELVVPDEMFARVDASLPELPDAKRSRFVADYAIPAYDAGVLTASREMADYFETVAATSGDAKAASNWVMGEVSRELNERRIDIDEFPVAATKLGELVKILGSGTINTPTAKDVFRDMLASGKPPADIISEKGLEQISDDSAIETMAAGIVEAHPDEVERYLGGKDALLKFFVGQVMKQSKGKANPQMAEGIIKKLLEAKR